MLSCKCTFKNRRAVLPLVSITRWRVMLSCKCTFKNPVPPYPLFPLIARKGVQGENKE